MPCLTLASLSEVLSQNELRRDCDLTIASVGDFDAVGEESSFVKADFAVTNTTIWHNANLKKRHICASAFEVTSI